MLNFKQLCLEDKETVDKYLKAWNSDSSEMSFANIYTWACSFNTQFAIDGGALYLIHKFTDNKVLMRMPIPIDVNADLSAYIEVAKGFCYDNKLTMDLRISSEEMLDRFKKDYGEDYNIEPHENGFDYVYTSKSLIELSGKKLHSKRNHINKFLSLYEPTFKLFDDSNIVECLELYNKWLSSKDLEIKNIMEESCAIDRTLKAYNELGLTGCIIEVKGKVEAFAFGEKLNDNTALIHIEKYNAEFEGISSYVNKAFVENCWSELEFINREEDMGIEGLRRAKKSYNPIKMVEKYIIKNFVVNGEK